MERTGWLLYEPEDAQKNRWFIDKIRSECDPVPLKLVYPDSVPAVLSLAAAEEKELPSFVINRSRNADIACKLESLGIRVFNPGKVTRIGNDKDLSYRLAGSAGIPYMPYITASEEDTGEICKKAAGFGYPLILKPSNGHGGKHVYMIDDESRLRDALDEMADSDGRSPYEKLILQRPCGIRGKDLRVYLINNRIIAGMMRISGNDHDFRANFSLGGKAILHELTDNERYLTEKLASALPSDFIGIDFIYDGDGVPVFNEIEDAVGSRMLYAGTDIDIISLFARHIRSSSLL